ncbi:multidrug efflux pump [Limimonas halophila]|uniref:Multidrug efflux pump n=1 Tax=Limimonas halophila TaxID=1082479 RepID=A0A1G7L012_9PROT|nr:efflux RND transporter permease subunit [Limimonas halophila]SDF42349.1 multidrug efflux pump [Limimonas halophila]
MRALIDAAFAHTRTVLLVFAALVAAGAYAYVSIPKEAEPDVTIPTIHVSILHEGISPEDAERLLIRPMEQELQGIEGLDELSAQAAQGYASLTLEFEASFDSDQALQDVREKVDIAKAELPPDAEEPVIREVNVALFPVLTAVLSGGVPERTLLELARDTKDRLESLEGVLEVEIAGDREDVAEVIVDPTVMQTYDLSYDEILRRVQNNNRLVAAGDIDTGTGRMVIKVPGLVEDVSDVLTLPLTVDGDRVVTIRDIATVRRTYKDPTGFARADGQPAVALEITKRVGANIIETVENARAVVERSQERWPEGVRVSYTQDKSERVRSMLGDLENNVVTAVVLVMIVVVAALGPRSSLLVGLAIPGAFLTGILAIDMMGFTLNIVVLFSLIMVVGILVDGAIVVAELADRNRGEGYGQRESYSRAAKRMFWPITSGVATTLAVFFPLLWWPGIVGEFMQYLPISVILTLTASLAMALIVVPVLGGVLGGQRGTATDAQALAAAEGGNLADLRGMSGVYVRLLRWCTRHALVTLVAVLAVVIAAYAAYAKLGRGIELFPDVEPEFAQIQVQARGNLSIHERDRLVRAVERHVLDEPAIDMVYARSIGETQRLQNLPQDAVGFIQLEFADWQLRPPADAVLGDIREQIAGIPGIKVQVREAQPGPGQGKPIQMEVTAAERDDLAPATERIRAIMRDLGGFVDVSDSRSPPGVEWRLALDRGQAARFGADVTQLGQAVQMVTNGVRVAEYQPDDTDEEVDIRVRYPFGERSLDQLDQLKVPTALGQIPITNFIELQPAPKTGTIERVDAERVIEIGTDVAQGRLVDTQVKRLQAALADAELPPGVEVAFKGENEDIQETMNFLVMAFAVAVFLMFILLVTQFNSIYQALLVMSAIVLSTGGVLIGLLIRGEPFGVVMAGIGVIALAGIVVNNNIVLIDTYNDLRRRAGLDAVEAALRTGAQRLRPVLLTTVTTVLGLLPMVLALNVDLIGRELAFGAPSTQWWTQLAAAIAGGLTFATVLTLVFTPALLVLGERTAAALRAGAARLRGALGA